MPASRTRPYRTRRRVAAALASAAAAVLLAAPAGAQAESWIDGPSFATSPLTAGGTLAQAPDGSSTAAWVGLDITGPGGAQLSVQHASPSGDTGPVQAFGAASEAIPPAVATGPSGATAVAWVGETESGDRNELKVALFAPDGTTTASATVASVDSRQTFDPTVGLDVDADGDATVAWHAYNAARGDAVQAARVSATGSVGTTQVLSATASSIVPRVAVAPSGVAWVGWADANTAWAARLGADGQVDAGAVAQPVSDAGAIPLFSSAPTVGLAASAAGGVLEWTSGSDPSAVTTEAVRLPLSGDLVGQALDPLPQPVPFDTAAALAIGPDGTITLARSLGDIGDLSGPTPDPADLQLEISLTRIAPGAASGSSQTISAPPAGVLPLFPSIASTADGTLLVSWLESRGLAPLGAIVARRITPDGTLGPLTTAVRSALLALSGGPGATSLYASTVDSSGGALIGTFGLGLLGGQTSVVALDAAAPVVNATIPASGVVDAPLAFSASATDRTGVSLWWEFGDDSDAGSSRAAPRHTYHAPGTYTVRLTATDRAGNETVVTRQVQIATPAGPPNPLPPVPAPNRPASADLKISQASRNGARVTVSGTISNRASGKVTIAYAQRIGRRTVTTKTTARIARGRWSATLRLSGSLARARGGRATVTVSYAGDAGAQKASAKRAVTRARTGSRAGGRGRGRSRRAAPHKDKRHG
ncbi:PKD domain-containing protein [Conexibacter sp. CPCC 206217]|uniref:PKD domain-containing protein n=1 Tax=Conexibacter sp. CPCC 206217 TaxID=3064574 RepID=UPI00271FDA3B|nr:PKD domain-containing protein [Conexibacter sp. CPCC 206217]MDO8211198.1 PKD domain-containing protein [Conexibacter sp. CPCC 206217]